MTDYIDIVFDGPPGHVTGRFVEVENSAGASISFGEWVHRHDGYWVIRFPTPMPAAVAIQLERVAEAARKYIEAQVAIHENDPYPIKYRAAFGEAAELRNALNLLDATSAA